VDAAGNAGVATSSWRIVTVPPAAPAIDGGPPPLTGDAAATFAFSHPDPEVSLECRLDDAAFSACTSPRTYGAVGEGSHLFEVRAIGITGLASAPANRTWVVDTVPPPVPTLDSAPPDPSGSADASFAFSSTGAAGFECSLDDAPFAACASPAAFAALTDGTHTFEVRALDAAGNASLDAGHVWRIVTVAPAAPAIDGGPPPLTSETAATIAFSHPDPDVSFECRLDGAAFAACTSPRSYTSLTDGMHAFDVRAVGVTGLASEATSRGWTVDTTPPSAPALVSAPPDPSGSADASFAFSSAGAAGFECSLDAAPPTACASPRAYAGLSDGRHTFLVRAFDAVGNRSETTHAWTVKTQPPAAPTIDSSPPGATTSTSATLAFSHPEPGVTFECSLDGAAFAPCTSPRAYAGLADGSHAFGVRARNDMGVASVQATLLTRELSEYCSRPFSVQRGAATLAPSCVMRRGAEAPSAGATNVSIALVLSSSTRVVTLYATHLPSGEICTSPAVLIR
jgi:hypothetical protein